MTTHEDPKRPSLGATPQPGKVCLATDLWPGTLDALVWDDTTRLANGYALVVDGHENRYGYELAVCGDRHVHLRVGLGVETGEISPLVVAAYVFALYFDIADPRRPLAGGHSMLGSLMDEPTMLPNLDALLPIMRQCLAVCAKKGTARYSQWLTPRVAGLVREWCDDLTMKGSVNYTPHIEV